MFLFDLLLYIHGKQLWSCQDAQLLNHTVPGQASNGSLPVQSARFLPVTDNLFFLIQQKREIFFCKRMCWTSGSISGLLLM